jgi:hypothetical protein
MCRYNEDCSHVPCGYVAYSSYDSKLYDLYVTFEDLQTWRCCTRFRPWGWDFNSWIVPGVPRPEKHAVSRVRGPCSVLGVLAKCKLQSCGQGHVRSARSASRMRRAPRAASRAASVV